MQNQAKNLVPRALRLVIHHSAFTLLFFLTGCQVLGLAAYKLHGPAKVPAKYLPQRKPMLVLVENYRHQSSVNAHADVLVDHCRRSNAGLFYASCEEFVECVHLLLADRELRDRMGRNGRTYVNDNYAWDVIMAKYDKLIAALPKA